MSVPIYCPECDRIVSETAIGNNTGKFTCSYCGIQFEQYENDVGGISVRILSE